MLLTKVSFRSTLKVLRDIFAIFLYEFISECACMCPLHESHLYYVSP